MSETSTLDRIELELEQLESEMIDTESLQPSPRFSPWLAFGVGCGVGGAVAVGLMLAAGFTPFG